MNNEFFVRSINKSAYLISNGLEYRAVKDENQQLVFGFNKSDRLFELLDNYREATRGKEVNVNLGRFLDGLAMLNKSIREFRYNN